MEMGNSYLAHSVVVCDQRINSLDGHETLINGTVLDVGVENVGGYDGGQIMNVHLASGVLVHMRERRCPIEEREQDFHRISMGLGQETARQVQNPLLLFRIGEFCQVS